MALNPADFKNRNDYLLALAKATGVTLVAPQRSEAETGDHTKHTATDEAIQAAVMAEYAKLAAGKFSASDLADNVVKTFPTRTTANNVKVPTYNVTKIRRQATDLALALFGWRDHKGNIIGKGRNGGCFKPAVKTENSDKS